MKLHRAVLGLCVVLCAGSLSACRGGGNGNGKSESSSSAVGEYKGIRAGKVDKGDVEVTLPVVGTLAPVVRIEVKSVLSGRITELHVREGEHVKAGQRLATLEPGIDQLREVSAISSGVERAQLELRDSEIDLEHTLQLAAKGFASRDAVKAAEKRLARGKIDYASAKAQEQAMAKQGVPTGGTATALKSFSVTAPASGVVVDRRVEVGEVVSSGISGFNQGTALFELAHLEELKVELFVNEVDIGKVGQDYPASVTVDAFRGRKWEGRVEHIAPQARKEGQVRGFDVEIKLVDEPGPLRPGMTANVTIRGEKKEGVLRAPVESLFRKDGDDVLYVLKDGTPEAVEVGVGLVSLEWLEVLSGVEEGAEITLQHPERYLEEQEEAKRKR